MRGRTLIDIEPNLARSGKRDEPCLRMLHYARAEFRAAARAEIYYAFGHAGFDQRLKKFRRNGRRLR